ncbi:hypothetical protein BT63DRAFT_420422 [Microthyrium microscopicum]|uniref:Uncharacterized protein n=1 Tax=Microthyrium microscopicum TaxID=703497 RepID=A0A6A6UVV6_9PEZI|nr:hypothetical protein BT63DRAFT_420422 [Microthyrium microscopicum]
MVGAFSPNCFWHGLISNPLSDLRWTALVRKGSGSFLALAACWSTQPLPKCACASRPGQALSMCESQRPKVSLESPYTEY